MTEKSVVGKACSKLSCSLALVPNVLHLPFRSNAQCKANILHSGTDCPDFNFTFSKKSKGKRPWHARYLNIELWHPKIGSVHNGFKPILVRTVFWKVTFSMWFYSTLPRGSKQRMAHATRRRLMALWETSQSSALFPSFRDGPRKTLIWINRKAPSKRILTVKCCTDKMVLPLQKSLRGPCMTKESTPGDSLQGDRCALS